MRIGVIGMGKLGSVSGRRWAEAGPLDGPPLQILDDNSTRAVQVKSTSPILPPRGSRLFRCPAGPGAFS
jgi:hypothetical protein